MSAGTNPIAQQNAERNLVNASIARLTEHPLKYLASRAKAMPHLWIHSGMLWFADISFRSAITSRQYTVVAVKILLLLIFSLIPLTLAIVGIYLSRQNWRKNFPLLLLPMLIGVTHLPLWIEDRYGTPAVPFFLIFAAFALTKLRVMANEMENK